MVILFEDLSLEDKTVYLDIFGRYVAFNMTKKKKKATEITVSKTERL